MVRRQFIFYGRVQGVGFRYRANYAAASLGLTGWVRNEWDGSVTLEVQGEEELIQKMLFMIRQGAYVNIEDMKIKQLPIDEEEKSFYIR